MTAIPQRELRKISESLLIWFDQNHRDLPWRKSRDPYPIWISEVMLQQTTTRAVIPFFEKFLKRFPTVDDLAATDETGIYPYWAGLGYYSRARNILKAAQLIHETGFPKTASELMALPGFGPYTARAVSSQAFNEPVGVVDGNVIRVLSRYTGQAFEWWKSEDKNQLQHLADSLVPLDRPGDCNQAVMELGATICTPKSPNCFLCPWRSGCRALAQDRVHILPLAKAKRDSELWLWEPELLLFKDKLALIENDYAPFLKKQWFFPGQAQKIKTPPKDFDFTHGITHHKIYVRIKKRVLKKPRDEYRWIKPSLLSEVNPASLLKKALARGDVT